MGGVGRKDRYFLGSLQIGVEKLPHICERAILFHGDFLNAGSNCGKINVRCSKVKYAGIFVGCPSQTWQNIDRCMFDLLAMCVSDGVPDAPGAVLAGVRGARHQAWNTLETMLFSYFKQQSKKLSAKSRVLTFSSRGEEDQA